MTTPSPTRMANPSTVSGALAPRSRATPAPITGTASPTWSAMSRSDVKQRRRPQGGGAPHAPAGAGDHADFPASRPAISVISLLVIDQHEGAVLIGRDTRVVRHRRSPAMPQ